MIVRQSPESLHTSTKNSNWPPSRFDHQHMFKIHHAISTFRDSRIYRHDAADSMLNSRIPIWWRE